MRVAALIVSMCLALAVSAAAQATLSRDLVKLPQSVKAADKEAEMRDFLDAITKHPGLFTTIVTPSGEGMSVSYTLP